MPTPRSTTERAAQLERERVTLAQKAVDEERLRIARELHDVVAHAISLIAVQSSVALDRLRQDPDATARALGTIETSSRGALAEMRRMLAILRQDDESLAQLVPSAGVADLPALAREASTAGVVTRLVAEGERPPAVPSGVDLCGYRIVQEALTNVVKHAPGASAEVVGALAAGRPRARGQRRRARSRPARVDREGEAGRARSARHARAGGPVRRVVRGRSADQRWLRRPGAPAVRGAGGRAGLAARCRGDPMITVAVVDDEVLLRSGLASLIEAADDMTVVGEASNGAEARRARAAAATRRRAHGHPDARDGRPRGDPPDRRGPRTAATRVLILTTFDHDEYVYEALRVGASGFLLKAAMPDELRTAVRVIASGEGLLAPSVTRRLIEDFASRPVASSLARAALPDLTDREQDVLTAVAQGLSNAEICAGLHMSLSTAKTHISHLLMKLDARDRTQLVVLAYEAGFAVPGTP